MPLDRHRDSLWPGIPAEGGSLSKHGNATPDYKINAETGCWEWQKSLMRGYGRVSVGSVSRWAHRAYYEVAFGPVPDGDDVHHRCENPCCVNPDHLEHLSRSRHLAGHKQADSTLTWDDVRAIRNAFKNGAGQYELMRIYGIAQPTLSDIATNTTWVDPAYEPGRIARCVECGEEFSAWRCHQRFCCEVHRKRFNNRRRYREINGIAA